MNLPIGYWLLRTNSIRNPSECDIDDELQFDLNATDVEHQIEFHLTSITKPASNKWEIGPQRQIHRKCKLVVG